MAGRVFWQTRTSIDVMRKGSGLFASAAEFFRSEITGRAANLANGRGGVNEIGISNHEMVRPARVWP
jgi:hypothetical protein